MHRQRKFFSAATEVHLLVGTVAYLLALDYVESIIIVDDRGGTMSWRLDVDTSKPITLPSEGWEVVI